MNQPKLYIIAAMSENHVIGYLNKLPWHLPDEWKYFRQVTDGKAFLMGRTSFDAPDALHSTYRNVVLSSHPVETPNTETATSMEAGLALLHNENEVFILGGASVFQQAIDLAERLYLTIVHAHIEGDAFFPTVDVNRWELTSSKYHAADDEHRYAFSMNVYERKKIDIT